MSAVPKRKLTEAEYLVVERAAEFKSEFYDGEMFPLQGPGGPQGMAGASRQHCDLVSNLHFEIASRLRGTPCRTAVGDQRVRVDRTRIYTYPDLLIACGPRAFAPDDPDTLLNPQVVIEVLSPSTESYDRGGKFAHYQRLPSVREYVLVSQDRIRVERFVRQPDETWVLTTFDDPAGEFVLATVPVRVPLTDVYRDVELPDPPPR